MRWPLARLVETGECLHDAAPPVSEDCVCHTVVGGLAGLLFGFDTAVISGTTAGLTRAYNLTPGGLGLTVSIALWGTVAGAVVHVAKCEMNGSK